MTDNNDEHSSVDQVPQDFVSPWQVVTTSHASTSNEEFSADDIPLGVESDIQHLDLACVSHHPSIAEAEAPSLRRIVRNID